MMILLELEPVDVGILLDALTDYAQRTRMEAEGEQLATVPSQVVVHLARGVAETTRKIVDQLAEHADAVPAVDRAFAGSGIGYRQ